MFSRLTPWLISIVAIVVALFCIKSCSDKKEEGERFKSNLLIAKDSVHHLKEKNGELINRVGSMQLTVEDLRNQNQQLEIDKDALKKQIGNLSNLLNYYKGQIKSQGVIFSKVHDTIVIDNTKQINQHLKRFTYNNKFLKLDQIYNPQNDSIKINYTYSTGFTLTTYYKPIGLFKMRKQLVTDITLNDPNASLIKGQSVTIIQPPKKWYETTLFKIGVGFVAGKYLLK